VPSQCDAQGGTGAGSFDSRAGIQLESRLRWKMSAADSATPAESASPDDEARLTPQYAVPAAYSTTTGAEFGAVWRPGRWRRTLPGVVMVTDFAAWE